MSERQGLPSASGIERLALCPGSFRLEQGMPDTSSAESESGTRVHAWLAGDLTIPLTDEEMELAQSIQATSDKILERWSADMSPMVFTYREQRVWMHDKQGWKIASCQYDFLAVHHTQGLLLDFKSGRGEVQSAAENLQLRAQAVMVAEEFGLDEVTVGIVQPFAASDPVLCRYDQAAVAVARQELIHILAEANEPDAPRVPGDQQCKYCKAALICPARKEGLQQLATVTIHETGLTVSNQELAQLRDKCGPAKKMIAAIEKECFTRAQQDPEAWRELGFEITTPKGRNEIADMPAVAAKLNEFGVPWEDISAKCKMSKGSVKDLLRPVLKGKDITLKDAEWSVLKGNTETREGKPRLTRIGASEEDEE